MPLVWFLTIQMEFPNTVIGVKDYLTYEILIRKTLASYVIAVMLPLPINPEWIEP